MNEENKVTIKSLKVCPSCSKPLSDYDNAEEEYELCEDQTGWCKIECECGNCGKRFTVWIDFNYQITDYSVDW